MINMPKEQIRAYLQSLIEAYENSTFYENPKQPTYRYIPVSENDVKALRLAMALIINSHISSKEQNE